jgi:Ca2+/Na+ antiporter
MFIAITIISKRYAKSVEKVELPEEATLDPDEINSVKAILFFVFSILLVSFFGNQFVNDILFLIDTSPTFKKFSFIYIGVIIAIPELVVSIIGIYKEKATFVLGSIIGGTIWDLVVSVSVQALVNPLSDISSQVITFFLINVIISCVISVIYIRTHWKLKMWEAICLILVYMIIIGSIIILT